MPIHLDTQILVRSMEGDLKAEVGSCASSTAVNEFLEVYHLDKLASASYYVPVSAAYLGCALRRPSGTLRDHRFHKKATDQLLVEFAGKHPSLVDFGNEAISRAINERDRDLYAASIGHFERRRRQVLQKRFAFLCDLQVKCIPVNEQHIRGAMALLDDFLTLYTPKARFRNSWNDLLILACAQLDGASLWTEDKLLAAFSASHCGANLLQAKGHERLQFSNIGDTEASLSRKLPYVNHSWRVRRINSRLMGG